jgi:phenylpropionate dioxygenase-like ring-hydroxylating dioxygenase large terminal subunit
MAFVGKEPPAGLRAGETTAPEASTSTTASQYDWFEQWYPVNVVETMDPTRPHEVQLLGLNLVAWNDGPTVNGKKEEGTWHVFDDACPHRLAPLSEGRVEDDGTLMCSYHGWRFNGDAECSDLPYAEGAKAERLRSCNRASGRAYPTRVVDGMLWVFPRCDPGAFDDAERVPMCLVEELHKPGEAWNADDTKGRWKWKIPAGVRDFPCGWDMMAENTLDPAHFCAAHHNTLGNRYTDPAPFEFRTTRPVRKETGFQVRGDMGMLEFQPPCLVKYAPDWDGMPFGGNLVIATYCVPTKPGWVRPLANVLVDNDREGRGTLAERALGIFFSPLTPKWLGHVLASIVLHQDAGLLYKQYRNFRERGYGRWQEGSNQQFKSADTSSADTRDDRSSLVVPTTPVQPARAGPRPRMTTGKRSSIFEPAPGSDMERAAGAPRPPRYEDFVFTPTSVDMGVHHFRQWLRMYGGNGIPWASEDVLPARGTEDIFDMHDAHTKHCQYCQGAQRNLEILRYTSLAAFLAAIILMPVGEERTVIAAGSGLAALAIGKFNTLFRRYEYYHADND